MISVSFHWTFVHFLSLVLDFDEFIHRQYFNHSKYFQGFSYSWLFNFQDAFSLSVFCQTTHLLYHTFLHLSTPFQKFFEDFFISFSEIFVCYKLFYYTTFFFVCQALFRTFLKFFLSSSFLLNFSLVRYFLVYHIFSLLSRPFVIFFLPFFEFAFSELLPRSFSYP